eukprot:g2144.t1
MSSLKDVAAIARTNSVWREYVGIDDELWGAIAQCQFPHIMSLRAALPRTMPYHQLVQQHVKLRTQRVDASIMSCAVLRDFTFSFVPQDGGEALSFSATDLFEGKDRAISVPEHFVRSIFARPFEACTPHGYHASSRQRHSRRPRFEHSPSKHLDLYVANSANGDMRFTKCQHSSLLDSADYDEDGDDIYEWNDALFTQASADPGYFGEEDLSNYTKYGFAHEYDPETDTEIEAEREPWTLAQDFAHQNTEEEETETGYHSVRQSFSLALLNGDFPDRMQWTISSRTELHYL